MTDDRFPGFAHYLDQLSDDERRSAYPYLLGFLSANLSDAECFKAVAALQEHLESLRPVTGLDEAFAVFGEIR